MKYVIINFFKNYIINPKYVQDPIREDLKTDQIDE